MTTTSSASGGGRAGGHPRHVDGFRLAVMGHSQRPGGWSLVRARVAAPQ